MVCNDDIKSFKKLTICWTTFLHKVNNPILKGLCKIQLQLFKVLKVPIYLYCGSHVGGQENDRQPIFPYDIIENSPTSFAHNSVFVGPNDFICGTDMFYGLIGHINIWDKSTKICIIMFFMTSYGNHQQIGLSTRQDDLFG